MMFPMHEDSYAIFFSFHRPMLSVATSQTSTGRPCPHLLKLCLPKINDKNSSTLVWTITIWPMNFHYMTIAIMLSTTMPRLLEMFPPRPRLPHQVPCVLTLLFRIYISNQTLRRTRMSYLMNRLCTLQQSLLEPSSTICLTRALSPMCRSMNSFDSSQLSTCTIRIPKSL